MNGTNWKPADYRIARRKLSLTQIAEVAYPSVCRCDWVKTGFCLIDLGAEFGSRAMRAGMVEMVAEFDRLFREVRRKRLDIQSMTRFDQQSTTKPHRDGSDEESVLVLGYEPTLIDSRLFLSDFSVCAGSQGLYPAEFLEKFNPMYARGAKLLTPFTTELTEFNPRHFQILIINNSCARGKLNGRTMQGVLHHAEVPHPRTDALRIINSVVLTPQPLHSQPRLPIEERQRFLESDELSEYSRT